MNKTHITGILKEEVTINGVTHKIGEELTVPMQYGLEEYFEKYTETTEKSVIIDEED